jgi:hypothetical protein
MDWCYTNPPNDWLSIGPHDPPPTVMAGLDPAIYRGTMAA